MRLVIGAAIVALACPVTGYCENPEPPSTMTNIDVAKPQSRLGITYGATGLPLGFGHLTFDQTDVQFEHQFLASACIHYPRAAEHPGAPEVCTAQFKQAGQTIQISAWFASGGRMTGMAELIEKDCAAHSAYFSQTFFSQDRQHIKLLAGEFLPYRWLPFADSATISAWSANDEVHAMTACQSNDSGMVLLGRGSLKSIEERVRTRHLH
jgi:hypothetical protein